MQEGISTVASGSKMDLRLTMAVTMAAALLGVTARAEEPIRLSGNDVYFQFAGLAVDHPGTGSRFNTYSKKASATRLCGFTIRGNHYSRANPHIEWDLNIDQIVAPDRSIAGVSAGTFEVLDHKRRPRPPITDLSFTFEGVTEPIVAAIQGAPNADNGIVAMLEAEPANRLFAEFQTMRPIVISLRYADGSGEQLEVRGFRDSSTIGSSGGKNGYFAQCLAGFRIPIPGETTRLVK